MTEPLLHKRGSFTKKAGDTKKAPEVFADEERVLGKYGDGNWYKATVKKRNEDGTYTLDWDDGDVNDRVKGAGEIRKLALAGASGPSIEEYIRRREKESIRTFFWKSQQNLKEAEVLDMLIARLGYHAQKVGDSPPVHLVMNRIGRIAGELAEAQKRFVDFKVMQYFMLEVQSLEGMTPLPEMQHIKNFIWAIDNAFDIGIELDKLTTTDDPPVQEPSEADADEDDHEEGEGDEGDDEEDDQEDEGDDEDKDAEEGEDINEDEMSTLADFLDKWEAWKLDGADVAESEQEEIKKTCPEVSEVMGRRLEIALEKFERFPLCRWFKGILSSKLEKQHFKLLQWNYQHGDDELREDMPWLILPRDMETLEKTRGINESDIVLETNRDLDASINKFSIKSLPTFLLHLTRLKAVLISQAEQAQQLSNKVLALTMTASLAVCQVLFRAMERSYLGATSDCGC